MEVFLGGDFCWPQRMCLNCDRKEGGECRQLEGRFMDHMVGALVFSLLSYSILKQGRESLKGLHQREPRSEQK